MSDKNFKVKNGIDAAGKLTITNTSGATSLIEVNGAGGGQFTVTPYGGISTNAGFQSIGGPSYFGGYGGTTSVVVNVTGASGQTEDLQRWTTFGGTVLAKVDSAGSISATDLTLSGNLTVNGTTTNLNSTNLIIEDKNIIIADVATPTDTTADGAGITIKGATDKTFNWVNSTKSFTSSEPLIINNTSTTTVPLTINGYASQTSNLFEIKDSSSNVLFKITPPAGNFAYNNRIVVRPGGSGGPAQIGSESFTFRVVATGSNVIGFGTHGGGTSFDIIASDTFNRYRIIGAGTGVAPTFTTEGNDTDVNMYITAKGAGKIGINKTSPTGYVHAVSSSSSTVGLIVEGASGQTSTNIFEVQRAGGGDASFSVSHNYIDLNRNTTAAASMTVYGANAGAVPLYVKGRASQTANLQEWQNDAGTVKAFIDNNGAASFVQGGVAITGGSSLNVTNNIFAVYGRIAAGSTSDSGAQLESYPSSATKKGLVIKGYASQTADLQQWQDSAGTVLSSVSSNGKLYVYENTAGASGNALDINQGSGSRRMVFGSGGLNVGSTASVGSATWNALAQFEVYPAVAGRVGLVIKGAASQTADLQQWQDSDGNTLATLKSSGTLVINGTNSVNSGFGITMTNKPIVHYYTGNNTSYQAQTSYTRGNTTGIWMNMGTTGDAANGVASIDIRDGGNTQLFSVGYTGNTLISLNSASSIGLIIKGYTSQTANLQEWQNSAGTVLGYIGATGGAKFAGLDVQMTGSAIVNIGTAASGLVGLVIRGVASQTGDLQQWQNSSGTVNARIDAYGTFQNGTAGGYGAWINVQPAQASDKGIVIRGAASQTANLQEWQNNSGGVDTAVTSTGRLSVRTTLADAGLNVGAPSAATVNLIVRGAASQTANLQEWQNSAGTVLASIGPNGTVYMGSNGGANIATFYNGTSGYGAGSINSAGTFNINGANLGFPYTASGAVLSVNATYAGALPLSVRGYASQTANLQEWQDSTGAVLAGINSTGSLNLAAGKQVIFGNYVGTKINLGYSSSYQIGVDDYTIVLMADNTTNIGKVAVRPSSATYGTSYVNPIELYANGQIKQNLTIASTVGLTIKGADSQTANLQEWRQFNNVIGTRIGPFGELVGNNTLANGIGGTIGLVMWSVISGAANFVPIVAKGHSSQSANLQEWQDSSGTVLVSVLSNGRTTIRSNGADYGAALSVGTNSTTAVGLAIRGVASQTANLQEWQNSAGTTAYLNSALQYYNPGRISILDQNFSAILSVFSGNPAAIVSIFRGASSQSADLTRWQNSAGTTLAKLDYAGNFSAVSKSFDIPHPTKENMRLRYASLEGPENGVYIRGTTESNIIELPEYWTGLVYEDSITVSLTAVGSAQNIYVEKIEDNKVYIGGELRKAFFIVYGERKDIDKLTVEY